MFATSLSHKHVARGGGILSGGVRRRARRPAPRAWLRLPPEALEDRCLLSITEFPLPANGGSGPEGITLGPDGNLWFTMGSGIGMINPITPAPCGKGSRPVLGRCEKRLMCVAMMRWPCSV